MTHTRSLRTMFASLSIALAMTLGALLGPVAKAGQESHAQAYARVLAELEAAPERLADELEKLLSGEVAHFDFLQYQHIEILRRARALSHPPTGFSESQRGAITRQARRVQAAASALEWPIADFLRGHAVLSGATANITDIAQRASSTADQATRQRLQHLVETSGQFRESQDEATRQALQEALDAVLAGALDEQSRQELANQQRLLKDHADSPQRALADIESVGLSAEIELFARLVRDAGLAGMAGD